MKDELGRQIMKEFVRLRAKTYSYLKDYKKDYKFQDYKNCLEAAQIERKINYLRKKT